MLTVAAFGAIGFVMERNGYPVAAMVLGIVMGFMIEQNLVTSIIKADGRVRGLWECGCRACYRDKRVELGFLFRRGQLRITTSRSGIGCLQRAVRREIRSPPSLFTVFPQYPSGR